MTHVDTSRAEGGQGGAAGVSQHVHRPTTLLPRPVRPKGPLTRPSPSSTALLSPPSTYPSVAAGLVNGIGSLNERRAETAVCGVVAEINAFDEEILRFRV